MKWAVYNLLFLFAYPFLLPGFAIRMLRRGGYAARMGDRFALYPESVLQALGRRDRLADSHSKGAKPGADRPVWIHAVSVGEVQVAGQLMREWRKAEPGVRFCFSTTSSTGWKTAEKVVGPDDVLIYNPIDFPTFTRAAFLTVEPRAVVLTESEIWPNMIRRAKKMGVPLFLINARVSDRSAPRYKAAKFFFGDIFSSFDRIFAQSGMDRERLVAAGAPSERVEVTGSFKFDVAVRNPAKETELANWLGVGNLAASARPKVLLGGSTWPGEDEALLRAYGEVLSSSADAARPLLVIAPRHFEKADAVEANIRRAGFECVRRSRGERASADDASRKKPPVFLADTTGELMGLYGVADAVFVGKSLCAHGSQNMIEPCLCGKPTFVGPYTENFRPVMDDLLSSRAILQVKDEAGLVEAVKRAMAGDAELSAMAERAKAAVENRRGVVARCLDEIRRALS